MAIRDDQHWHDERYDERRSRRLFQMFSPEAKRIDERDLVSFRGAVALAHRNVVQGVEAVLEHEKVIVEELPKIDIEEIRSLPELSLSVVYAATQVDRHRASSELVETLSRARELRQFLLVSAESLVHAGIFDAHEVGKIRAGRGDIDTATDCIELSALYEKHARAIRGKTPVTKANIREAADLGAELLASLKPKNVSLPKKAQSEVAEARDLRDRLYTLLVHRHDTLRRVGAYLFGLRDIDKKVPTLQTRVFTSSRGKKGAAAIESETTKESDNEE